MHIPVDIAKALLKYRDPQKARLKPEFADLYERHDVLVLYEDMGAAIGVRPDGELIQIAWVREGDAEPPESAHWRDVALVQGARRYPELTPLLPVRTADDRDCPHCHGTGKIVIPGVPAAEKLICRCAGLGWIPASWKADE